MKTVALVVVGALCAGLWSGAASAEPSDKDADAERLFREGQKLLEERRYGEACPKFEAAYRKDHQLGTLLNLAYCHKEQGATWVSWLEFKEAEVQATELKRTDRKDFARQRMTELEKSLARVVIDPTQKVELVELLVEERRVPEAEKSVPFAAEPGQRKITFRAKGKKEVVQLVTIVKGDRPQHIAVPPMEDQEKEPPVVAAPAPEPPKPTPVQVVAAPAPEGRSGQKTLAVVLGAVGIVGIGVGAATGVMTLSNECTAAAKRENPAGCPDNQAGRDIAARGETTGMVSNITFGVGGAALIAAVVLYVSAPSGKASAPADANAKRVRMTPELGTGWAGLRGVF
ncbi:MAG TPA: hypothetical protein VM925_18895 [Labilithrix sp.]|jgi:hypothetical protein|nr:hypothetical protein [Labilithrix sp.]